MYAIVETGGKQYKVAQGERLRVDRMDGVQKGDQIALDRILMLGGESPQVGKPVVEGAKVLALVTDMGQDGEGVKGPKLHVFKKKRRQGYHKTIGHRQRYTEIQIQSIEG